MTLFLNTIHCEWPLWTECLALDDLSPKIHEISKQKGELLTLWGTDERAHQEGFVLHLIFVHWNKGVLYIRTRLSEDHPVYPDLSLLFPVATRLQRALFDLIGFKANESTDQRPWLRHHAWPKECFPLRQDFVPIEPAPHEGDEYSFVKVGGAGVHEIGVGPVHAGIIEAGHFRFQVVGEHILRLEERLGYLHKGIDKHFQGAALDKASRLSGRISGDSTVAYAWAFSMALENAHSIQIPERAQWLRALLLERERIANHLGDLGGLGQDAGLNFAMNQFSRIKENMLRVNHALFQHRYLMDRIVPGGLTSDLTPEGAQLLKNEIPRLQAEIHSLHQIYEEHGGLQDRFCETGIVHPDLAIQLGLLGISGKASLRQLDWRKHMPHAPYDQFELNCPIESSGDVAARVWIRFREINESLRLMHQILETLPEGEIRVDLPKTPTPLLGFGCVEGWRGPVFAAVQVRDQQVDWAHLHDPSWQNWPALEFAVIGNIVPDFPLINKSFNLSYSGHDR